MQHSNRIPPHTPPLANGTTLTIVGSGTAYKIGNRTLTESASISLTAIIAGSSPGRGILNFTSGKLTIGSDTYTVVSGHGTIAFHSQIMTLHIIVKNGSSKTFQLILYGRHGKASSTSAFSVDFLKHRSRLDHSWFLKFPAAMATPS
jgi:hypothetical protein